MSSPGVVALVDELIGYFNRRVMDVPDGLFDRNTQFSLNGRTLESLFGRTDDDPLTRMLARSAAGYRFAAKALLHALETMLVSRLDASVEASRARVALALRGTLRGSGAVLDEVVTLDLALDENGRVAHAAAMIAEPALDRIRAARTA